MYTLTCVALVAVTNKICSIPIWHFWHCVVVGLYSPALQGTQEVEPGIGWTVPPGQSPHFSEPVITIIVVPAQVDCRAD